MIKIKNLTFGYDSGFRWGDRFGVGGAAKRRIFENFSLEIPAGEALLISGINGTGKTTLLRLIAGSLLPQGGSVEFAPELGADPRKKIGFISDKMNLYEDMTMEEAIAYHSSIYGISRFDMSLLDRARLKTDQKISELSVGQRLIFHLSLIMSSEPEIILIDEVVHSIDAYLREVFLRALMDLMAERSVTLVMVNLNFHHIEWIPQRVVLLRNGTVAVDEPMEGLKQKVKKITFREGPSDSSDSSNFPDSVNRLVEGLPVIWSAEYGDCRECYVYPFEEKYKDRLAAEVSADVSGEVSDLDLNDIIKAFIGGEYA